MKERQQLVAVNDLKFQEIMERHAFTLKLCQGEKFQQKVISHFCNKYRILHSLDIMPKMHKYTGAYEGHTV
jgi:transposase